MKGSDKQIKWAEDIKASKATEFSALRSKVISPIGIKALDYIESNDVAKFWIDFRSTSVMDMLNSLLRGGLQIKGAGQSNRAVMDKTTGQITVTWTAIVSDGKGGHSETYTLVL